MAMVESNDMMLELGQFNLRLVVSLVDFLIVVRVKASLSGEELVRRSLTAEGVHMVRSHLLSISVGRNCWPECSC